MAERSNAIAYWHIDAFAARPFGGNQAAVMVLDDWLLDKVLKSIAAENMFAATAFLVKCADGSVDWNLRWFTPTVEIAMCGHATLACGHAVLSEDGGDRVTFGTRTAGQLEVVRHGNGYELALPALHTETRPYPEAVDLLGAEPLTVQRNDTRHNIFLFEDEATVRSLAPNLRGLGQLGDDQFICTAPGDRTDIVSRVFVPGGGVDEDSVTGSAHAALAPFWAERLGCRELTANQASERGGDLSLRVEGAGAGQRVWLGGPCVTVVEGRFFL